MDSNILFFNQFSERFRAFGFTIQNTLQEFKNSMKERTTKEVLDIWKKSRPEARFATVFEEVEVANSAYEYAKFIGTVIQPIFLNEIELRKKERKT